MEEKPQKGILKSPSLDLQEPIYGLNLRRSSEINREQIKWDEKNIEKTLHPVDKDYGFMDINEPKTPFNYQNSVDSNSELNTEKLVSALSIQTQPKFLDNLVEASYSVERKRSFEERRKLHYNEFEVTKIAKDLIKSDLGDSEYEEETQHILEAQKNAAKNVMHLKESETL